MGLIKDLEENTMGLEIENAYFRIVNVLMNDDHVGFCIESYISKAARDAGKTSVSRGYKFDLNRAENENYFSVENLSAEGMNIYKACYLWLKTQNSYFSDAQDDI